MKASDVTGIADADLDLVRAAKIRDVARAFARERGAEGDRVEEQVGYLVSNAASDLVAALGALTENCARVAARLARVADRPHKANALGELMTSSDAQAVDRLCGEVRAVASALSVLGAVASRDAKLGGAS